MLLFLSLGIAIAALGYAVFALWVMGDVARAAPHPVARRQPPVTILKPLCGDEPDLLRNLSSFLSLDYPAYQVVFGVHDPEDPALLAVRQLQKTYPERDISLVIDGRIHGANRKVSNLINMLAVARHDVLVIADSDIRVTPDYLNAILPPLEDPQVGAVTALYVAMPDQRSLANRLACLQINSSFLPSVLIARRLGKKDFCLGATMAMRRDALDAIGGLDALRDYLADDYMLGHLMTHHGYRVELAAYRVAMTVAETTMPALLNHELRWARTVRTVQPQGYAMSFLTYPSIACFVAAILLWTQTRLGLLAGLSMAVAGVAMRLLVHLRACARLGVSAAGWEFLTLRDLLSFYVWARGTFGRSVLWRGKSLHVDSSGTLTLPEREPVQ